MALFGRVVYSSHGKPQEVAQKYAVSVKPCKTRWQFMVKVLCKWQESNLRALIINFEHTFAIQRIANI